MGAGASRRPAAKKIRITENPGPSYLSVCRIGNFCFNHRRSSVVWPEQIDACAEEPQGGSSTMRGLRLAMIVPMLLSPSISALAAQTKVAVFEFELIDTSLEGAMNGPRADEQRPRARLADQLRGRLAASGRYAPGDVF